MKAAPFDYLRARSVAEAVAALGARDGAVALAGGQSLVPLMAARRVRPQWVVDLNGLGPILGRLVVERSRGGPSALRIGALVRHSDLEHHGAVRELVPLLSDAASCVGYPAVRNRGTVGGSLAHCHPAAELPAALTAMGATAVVQGSRGCRSVPVAELARGPFVSTLARDEVLTEVTVPLPGDDSGAAKTVPERRTGSAWAEFSRGRREFPLVGVAAVVSVDPVGRCTGARAVACGVGPVPMDLAECLGELVGAERIDDLLADELASRLPRCIDPPSDLMGSGRDRTDVTGVVLRRALTVAWARAVGG